MKIKELYKNKQIVFSFEIFPPKNDASLASIYKTVEEIKKLNPDFISVTYSAGGSQNSNKTIQISSDIKNKYDIEVLAHLTSISSSKSDINQILMELKNNNIENILALRGDLPEGQSLEGKRDFKYAKDLIKHIKDFKDFSIGAACYPEGHIEAKSNIADLKYLKEKVGAGADFLISQLYFDNEKFYDFMEKLDLLDIDIPVAAGIMPILNAKQIGRMVQLSGASLPRKVIRILDKYEHNAAALKEAGIAYSIEQIIDLLAWGIKGVHLYTMNKADVAAKIVNSIDAIRNEINI